MNAACSHKDTMPRGLGARPLAQALRDAEAICIAANEPLTTPRRRVLEILLAAATAMKAYDIIGAYHGSGRPVSPTTVYRALEFLERMGFIHRLESLNAHIACFADRREHAAAFLICDCCGSAVEFEADLSTERMAAIRSGFKISRVSLEAQGLCSVCQERQTLVTASLSGRSDLLASQLPRKRGAT